MKIIPFDKVAKPTHSGYRGWMGRNPRIKIVEDINEADYLWFCAWGDGKDLRNDIEKAKTFGIPVIFNVTGDECYVPDVGGCHFYFNTTLNYMADALQIQVPYSYHDSYNWWVGSQGMRRKDTWLANFRGSFNTNPHRKKLMSLKSDKILIEECDGWQAAQRGEWDVISKHSDLLVNSIYTLCPRGFGSSSIRVAEAMFRGSIPVLLDDDSHWFGHPMDFCLRSTIETDNIDHIIPILEIALSEREERCQAMAKFVCEYLLIDHLFDCIGTVGYTEIIRQAVLALSNE